jgi:regulator of protease activity HflC (stomatin/prohibitin superfamily)
MPERPLDAFAFKGPKPQTILILIILLILFIVSWGSFALVPAGHRGVVLLWGSVERRIMGEGLNFKLPIVETVITVDVKVQPHPFKEIEAASKEYQVAKMTGMMNFHIDPAESDEKAGR